MELNICNEYRQYEIKNMGGRNSMKIIGVIPARYQSSRFPGKPLVNICGKPMIWWVYQQCIKVKSLDKVVVATDDERIFQTCRDYLMDVIMTSSDNRTGTDRVAEVARNMDADFYVNIQGDEPLIEPEIIDKVISFKMEHENLDVINTMTISSL
jgi:3-deoxy-manno-octulosonate cytidylyltransferase (CMP-KDO synthetase)